MVTAKRHDFRHISVLSAVLSLDEIPSVRYCSRMQDIKYAYSTFPEILAKHHLTVSEVHQRLLDRGFRFDRKTLYRLASHEPLQTISAPVVGALCEEFKIGIAELLTWERPKPKLHRIDAKSQRLLNELMAKNNEGTLTSAERRELARLGEIVERLSLENARMLASHSGTNLRSRAVLRTNASRGRRKKP